MAASAETLRMGSQTQTTETLQPTITIDGKDRVVVNTKPLLGALRALFLTGGLTIPLVIGQALNDLGLMTPESAQVFNQMTDTATKFVFAPASWYFVGTLIGMNPRLPTE